MATDTGVSPDNLTKRKTRVNDDGTQTPFVIAESAGGGTDSDVNLDAVGGAPIALGQTNKAGSLPVTIAVDQEDLVIPFTTSVAGVQDLLLDTPTAGFSKVMLIYTSTGSGLAGSVQFSPNAPGGTYATPTTFASRAAANSTPAASGTSANTFYESPVVAPFLKLRITALTSGTVSGYIVLSNKPMVLTGILAIPTGTYTTSIGTPLVIALTSAASTNATNSKNAAGTLYEIAADNMTASTKYLKLYNKASAPTVGTDVPILTIPIPANGEVSREFGVGGKRFSTGISFAITGAQAVSDTTAVAAGDVHVSGSYL